MPDDRDPKPAARKLQLMYSDGVADGIYSNFQVVGNNETEFIMDFAFVQPNSAKAKVRSRVILSPKHAKSLLRVLSQRVNDYERRFGEIPLRDPLAMMSTGGGGGLPN